MVWAIQRIAAGCGDGYWVCNGVRRIKWYRRIDGMYVSPVVSNKQLDDKAKLLVKAWAQDRQDARRENHRAVGGEPVMLSREMHRATEKPWKTPYVNTTKRIPTGKKDENGKILTDDQGNPLTEVVPITWYMDAKETRPPNKGDRSDCSGPMEHEKGGSRWAKDFIECVFRDRVMGMVCAVDEAVFDALEMHASGYNEENMKKLLRCGNDKLRSLLAKGYGVVSVLILLRKELNWDINIAELS